MVPAAELPRPFDGQKIPWRLDYAKETINTARVLTDITDLFLGQVEASFTVSDRFLHSDQGIGKSLDSFTGSTEQVKSQALGIFLAYTRQLLKLLD